MSKVAVAAVFGLFNTIDWVGTLVAILPLAGMVTNANGVLSGGRADWLFLILLVSLPVCAIFSTVLFKYNGKRIAGVLVAAIPTAIGLPLFLFA